jgi:hypothetical protein
MEGAKKGRFIVGINATISREFTSDLEFKRILEDRIAAGRHPVEGR